MFVDVGNVHLNTRNIESVRVIGPNKEGAVVVMVSGASHSLGASGTKKLLEALYPLSTDDWLLGLVDSHITTECIAPSTAEVDK